MLTLKINGSSSLSGLDAAAWKKMCTSFQSSSADLCYAVVSLTKRICISYNPAGLHPLLAIRLIVVDKHPGVRPIGVCEVVCRIIDCVPPLPSTIVTPHTPNIFHSVLFDSISPELIRSLMLKISGSSGPSGLDAAAWKKMRTSPLQLTYALLSLH